MPLEILFIRSHFSLFFDLLILCRPVVSCYHACPFFSQCNQLIHGVVNLAAETFGLVAQHRDPFSADEHHVLKQAAKLGHANDIVSYLLMKLVSKTLKNGSSSVISGGADGAGGPFFEGEPAVPTGVLQEALWLAVANGHAEAAVVLVEAGADLEACNSEGNNALFEAVRIVTCSMPYLSLRSQTSPSLTFELS